jgi:hypothetical protein
MSNNIKTIEVSADNAEAIFKRRLKAGRSIAVFINLDLGHPALGHAIFLPLDPDEISAVEVGKTRAPDTSAGLGWRYLLDSIHTTIDAFRFTGK